MTLPKISVTIITHNEEENIENCLKSIKWADEIVVVDSFSADKTLAICKKHKAKIIKHKWLGYSKQKNLAIDNARNEWVLSLDADERITKELLDEIKKSLRKAMLLTAIILQERISFLENGLNTADGILIII